MMTNTRVHRIWRAMLSRCRNPKTINYKHYGGRGIRVCKRWEKFENFFADMGHPPESHSLDRINSNGNYEARNCRWSSQIEQVRNTNKTIRLTINGATKPMAEWCQERGISYGAAIRRLRKGLSHSAVLSPSRLPMSKTKKRLISDEQMKEVRTRRAAGETLASIGASFNVKKDHIWARLKDSP